MVRIRGRIGDWPVDLTVDLDPQDWAQLAAAVTVPPGQVPTAVAPAPAQADQDGQWQTVLELLRRAGRIEGPQLMAQLAALAGGEVAGKRLLVRLRHCDQVRMETGADAPVYCWVGQPEA
ncbi:hypothetical protein BVH03_04045 [Pseudomonas sp. PA15(2017)]|uniref:hypothetical protein n=1 Tax=Pseudomonas sp. PA15(2017) TaxID=1932111 RepID=UPI000963E334|nr:hypothetical protein [Pseudomonas sp. PA15(2017)]OLU33607.1 hypothetical protein BVH03_04045 [Pseudomonas sp. PA15(2017)]